MLYLMRFLFPGVTEVKLIENNVISIAYEGEVQENLEAVARQVIDRTFNGRIFNYKQETMFEQSISTPYHANILQELEHKEIIIASGQGMYAFKEPFSLLLHFLDDSIVRMLAQPLKSQWEHYPSMISLDTLNKTNHFTSFPHHVVFTNHIEEDFNEINFFSQQVKENNGLNLEQLKKGKFKPTPYVKNPAICYHCYNALQGNDLQEEGRVITSMGTCSRYESHNHSDFGRLLDFSMREIVFIGTDTFVREMREKSITLLKKYLQLWQVDCYIENANDPFFTDDFRVKSFFQRDLEMKYELRFHIPYLKSSLAVCSSNYHGPVFGNAFHIQAMGKTASTGCLAFGLERWVLGFLAQYGVVQAQWPASLVQEFNLWLEQKSALTMEATR